jgi:PKD repeat protein
VFETYVFGERMTYIDRLGNPAVHVCAFDLTGTGFPSKDAISRRVRAGMKDWELGRTLNDPELTREGRRRMVGEGEFGMIMVSATREKAPVIMYYRGLPLHYVLEDRARDAAETHFGAPARLVRYVYASPFDIWAEYESRGRSTWVSTRDLSIVDRGVIMAYEPFEPTEEALDHIQRKWEKIQSGSWLTGGRDQFRITGVPDHDWSYGCSPTASANILDYWDANGYPLLTDYYFDRWDGIEGEWDYNLPNCQQQLAVAMGTDTITTGGTSLYDIASGTQAVCNSATWGNQYAFTSWVGGDNHTLLINEIEDYHPTHWALNNHPTYQNHSITAMGWGPPDNTYICIHDTWNFTPEDVVIDYYGWSGPRFTIPVIPGGGGPPSCDFTGEPTSGYAPLGVQFTDLSTGSITTWIWDFGDGDSSDVRHPLHFFTSAGTFDVKLKVVGSGGSDSLTRYSYVTVSDNPDSAWLSLNGSRSSKLTSLDLNVGDTVELDMILANRSDSAHSVLYPLCYDPDHMGFVDVVMDSSSFPYAMLWNFFEKDTAYNDSGKTLLYAWTGTYSIGIAPGEYRIGTLSLEALSIAETFVDTCFYPPQGHLYYTDGRSGIDYWPHWTKVDVSITIPNPDTAWLSEDPSGYPILRDLVIHGSGTAELGMFLKNAQDSAHSIMYPLCYDTSCLSLVDLAFDTSTFPIPIVWNFFALDSVINDTGKLMLYAWTSVHTTGVPNGVNRIGRVDIQGNPPASDSVACIIDTCSYPPQGHLYYTHAPSATDYWPDWVPVDVTVHSGLCGDANGDGNVTSGDGYHILNYFGAGPAPVSCWAANVNGDGSLTTGDGYHLLNWFGAGPDLDCAPCD